MRRLPHPIEPYRVCGACWFSAQSHAEQEGGSLEEHVREDDHSEDEAEKVRFEQAAIVQSRPSFMLKYLELDDSNMLAPSRRHAIVEKLKKTMKWLERHRSSQALKDKIVDLDNFMEDLLRTAMKADTQ